MLAGARKGECFPSAGKIQSDRLTQVLVEQGMKARIPAFAYKFWPINSYQLFLSQHWHFGNLFHYVNA